MTLRFFARTLSVMVASAALSSCSLGLTLRVSNATEQDLLVIQVIPNAPYQTAALKAHAVADIQALSRQFIIVHGGKANTYKVTDPPHEFNKFEGTMSPKRVLPVEYADDNCLYVGKRGDAQPVNFPVCP